MRIPGFCLWLVLASFVGSSFLPLVAAKTCDLSPLGHGRDDTEQVSSCQYIVGDAEILNSLDITCHR